VAELPSAWVLAEAVRSWHRLGGPWALLGASQWNQPATLVSASLGGVWLTSFLLVATNTAVAGVILHRGVARRVIILAVALVCAGLGPAWFVLSPALPVGPTVRVALVQPGDIADSVVSRRGRNTSLGSGGCVVIVSACEKGSGPPAAVGQASAVYGAAGSGLVRLGGGW